MFENIDMKDLLYALVVVLVIYALWYYFMRKQECSSASDCKAGESCVADGRSYCQKQSS